MPTATLPRVLVRSVSWGVGLATLWLAVAVLRDETTFHLAPLLVAGTPPVMYSFDDQAGASRSTVALASGVGFGLALMVTLALVGLDVLSGPALSGFPNAAIESLVFALAGAAIGAGVALLRLQ